MASSSLACLPKVTGNVVLLENSSGNVTHDLSSGTVFYHSNMTGNIVSNVVTTSNASFQNAYLIFHHGETPFPLSNILINGQQPTNINWIFLQGSSSYEASSRYSSTVWPTYTGQRYTIDIYSLDLVKLSSSWRLFARLISRQSTSAATAKSTYSYDTSMTTSTTISWIVPIGVYSISALCIGAGGGGYYYTNPPNQPNNLTGQGSFRSGNGGNLRYATSIPVTPYETLTIVRGVAAMNSAGTASSISRGSTVLLSAAGGGTSGGAQNGTSTTISGNIFGGNGGLGATIDVSIPSGNTPTWTDYYRGGGGCGGYAGAGGNGGTNNGNGTNAATNSYGGGGGSQGRYGGGTGNLGTTQNPTGSAGAPGGQGGAGTPYGEGAGCVTDGLSAAQYTSSGGYNYNYTQYWTQYQMKGGEGHVRIVFSAPSRAYPSTNVE